MYKKIRVGIIGAGKIAQFRHIPELYYRENVDIVSICDKNIDRANEVAQKYKINNVYSSYEELISKDALDAVTICLPNSLHARAALNALQSNLHVLVEKPMATSIEDCRLMVEAHKHSNKILMIGCNQRFHPVYTRVKEIIQSGKIGSIYQFNLQFHHGGPEQWSVDEKNSWFFDAEETGAGVIYDLGFHKIDLAQWILEDTIQDITSYQNCTRNWTLVKDNAVMMLKMKSGALGTISVSWCNPQQEHRSCFYGDKGMVLFGESLFGIKVIDTSGKELIEDVDPPLRPDHKMNSRVLDHFVDCILSGRPTESECTSVIHSMEALFALDM